MLNIDDDPIPDFARKFFHVINLHAKWNNKCFLAQNITSIFMPRILVNGIEQVDVVIDYSKTIDWSEYCIRIHSNFAFKQY